MFILDKVFNKVKKPVNEKMGAVDFIEDKILSTNFENYKEKQEFVDFIKRTDFINQLGDEDIFGDNRITKELIAIKNGKSLSLTNLLRTMKFNTNFKGNMKNFSDSVVGKAGECDDCCPVCETGKFVSDTAGDSIASLVGSGEDIICNASYIGQLLADLYSDGCKDRDEIAEWLKDNVEPKILASGLENKVDDMIKAGGEQVLFILKSEEDIDKRYDLLDEILDNPEKYPVANAQAIDFGLKAIARKFRAFINAHKREQDKLQAQRSQETADRQYEVAEEYSADDKPEVDNDLIIRNLQQKNLSMLGVPNALKVQPSKSRIKEIPEGMRPDVNQNLKDLKKE